jgi:capreomycidine synthase
MSDIPLAKLEEWMRRYYHASAHDIGSSGVRDMTLAELCTLCGVDVAEIASMVLHDSESFGGGRLRAALADRWTGGDVEPVMVTHGSSEAIYLVMNLAVDPGDHLVVVDPAYPQLHGIAAWRGCTVDRWPLRATDGFRADLAELRRIVARRRPTMIVANFPHNPTGVTITAGEQRELVEIAAGCGAWLVWDNAFGELTYDTDPLPLPWGTYERTICFGTFSKSYGLAGLRVGWCIAPPTLLRRMAVLRDYLALYVSPVLEHFAVLATRNAEQIVAMHREHAVTNRKVLLDWAAAHADLVRITAPAGGVSAFVSFPGIADAREVCRVLAERDGVLLVPGDCFGDDHRDHARLGFGGTAAELETGLDAVGRRVRAAR